MGGLSFQLTSVSTLHKVYLPFSLSGAHLFNWRGHWTWSSDRSAPQRGGRSPNLRHLWLNARCALNEFQGQPDLCPSGKGFFVLRFQGHRPSHI